MTSTAQSAPSAPARQFDAIGGRSQPSRSTADVTVRAANPPAPLAASASGVPAASLAAELRSTALLLGAVGALITVVSLIAAALQGWM